MNATRYRELLDVLNQVRTAAYFRKQRIPGGKGGVPIYVSNYIQTVSKGVLGKATSIPARGQLIGRQEEQSLLHSNEMFWTR